MNFDPNERELTELDIIDSLQELNFTKNDSRVLLTLCKYKILSPADIAKHSGVDRARVYDSLNRLIERGFIQKEPVKRGANYQVIPVEKIFNSIQAEYDRLKDEAGLIKTAIINLEITSDEVEPRVWSISSKEKIRKKIKDLISQANTRIFFIITPDLLMEELGGYEWITKELWNKKLQYNSINIIIAIAKKYFEAMADDVKKLLRLDIDIHSIQGDTVIPFGLLITDNNFLLTTLNQVNTAPEYTTGILLENGRESQLNGYEHLFRHFISAECKKAVITKSKEQSAEIY